MSMVEQAIVKAKELKHRVFETIDAFRPKILIKKPLTQLKPFQGEVLEGQGLSTIVERIQERIQQLRSGMGLGLGGEVSSAPVTTPSVEPMIIHKESKKKGIHY